MKKITVILMIFFASMGLNAQNFEKPNSIMVETNLIMSATLSYDRILPINEKMAVMLGGNYIMGVGFGWGANWIGPEANLLFFGPKHFLETGLQYAFKPEKDAEYEGSSPGIRVAYRLQGKKGLTFRASADVFFAIDPIFIPTVGLGHIF